MRSTFLLSFLLICALFSFSSASTLCVKLIGKAAYAPGGSMFLLCSWIYETYLLEYVEDSEGNREGHRLRRNLQNNRFRRLTANLIHHQRYTMIIK
ncbi:hypothetical protein V3C99_019012 [Haemonchus contortus]|uniref:Secreted protein n=1 Tax=Haemonchus contortus TaxID=6289 RepID=A0A7I4Z397_HAECO